MLTIKEVRERYTYIVIPCSSTKLNVRAPLEEFYCGSYFTHLLKAVKIIGLPYAVLSTEYGLITPAFHCQPYDLIWSSVVKNNNKSMRKRSIPVASEEHRQMVARSSRDFLRKEKVLTFCSLSYTRYFPKWDFFSSMIGSKGIGHNMAELNRMCASA